VSELVLHHTPPSHPCRAVIAALRLKGLAFEEVVLQPGAHPEAMAEVYGPDRTTVPGMLVDGEPVHGSVAILDRLEQLAPEPALIPSEAVREAVLWGDGELQDLGRRLPWGALHWCPQAMGTFGSAGMLDPAGTDYAIRFVRGAWKYHGITAQRLHEDLQALPGLLEHAEALAAEGVIGGEQATAADLQIGATLRVLLVVEDLHDLVGERLEAIARRWFADYPGAIPAGTFPAGWVPSR